MSSKGRRKQFDDSAQRDRDFFGTPGWAVRRLYEAYQPPAGHWLEPGAGNGAIIKATQYRRPDIRWTAVEIRSYEYSRLAQYADEVCPGNFLDFASAYLRGMRMGVLPPFSVAIGNPPYSLAQEFIDAALAISREVIFLLRLNFLGGDARSSWLKANYPDVYVLPNRVSGTGDGKTDSTEYGWMRFNRIPNTIRGQYMILNTTPVEERRLDYR